LAVFAIPGLLIAMAIVLTLKVRFFIAKKRIGRNGRRFSHIEVSLDAQARRAPERHRGAPERH